MRGSHIIITTISQLAKYCSITFKAEHTRNTVFFLKNHKAENMVILQYIEFTQTYRLDGQRVGLSSLSPAFNVLITSELSTPGYGILPSEKISQQVTPYDHYKISCNTTDRLYTSSLHQYINIHTTYYA